LQDICEGFDPRAVQLEAVVARPPMVIVLQEKRRGGGAVAGCGEIRDDPLKLRLSTLLGYAGTKAS